jgi:hypothetical protein
MKSSFGMTGRSACMKELCFAVGLKMSHGPKPGFIPNMAPRLSRDGVGGVRMDR